ncbi:unnamed protein product [Caenorhabditis angaria]|uniref:Uncharacterized protein n=1 Tax=Caenorhabditis angaria TaxID=860376 RepID=A0A9P1MXI0_9PELO|nr:unnamed protein product [Caenorhabditis angaria]
MFSKQVLIFLSISLIGLINASSIADVNIPMVFRKALNRWNRVRAINYLQYWLDPLNLTVIVCGETLATGSDGLYTLVDYLIYEGNRYNDSFTNITQYKGRDASESILRKRIRRTVIFGVLG